MVILSEEALKVFKIHFYDTFFCGTGRGLSWHTLEVGLINPRIGYALQATLDTVKKKCHYSLAFIEINQDEVINGLANGECESICYSENQIRELLCWLKSAD